MPPNELETVPLYESGHGGYGDGRNQVRPHRYNRVMRGFDNRAPGEAAFGPFITSISYPQTLDFTPLAAIEWRSTNGLVPVIFIIDTNEPSDGGRVFALQDGVITEVLGGGSTGLLTNLCTDAVMHDNGSGTPFIYFAEGEANDIERMPISQTLDSTVTGDVERDKLASINGYLYGSASPRGAGTATWAGMTFVFPGADPMNEANWSPIQVVGFPSTDITAIVRVQAVACVVKPEGIFVLSRETDLWENRMPSWERYPHPDNGRGAFTLGAAAVIPVARGGAVIFDGYTIRAFSPFDKLATPNLDTTQQTFSCMGMAPSGLLAVTTVNRGVAEGPGSRHRHGQTKTQLINSKLRRRGGADDAGATILGVRLLKSVDNGANFTDYTTEVNDSKISTHADLSSLSTLAGGDFVLIGHPRPFQSFAIFANPEASIANYNVNASVIAVHIWNGSSWVAVTVRDFTTRDHGNGQASFGKASQVIMTQDPVVAGWTADTIDNIFTVSEDTQSNFWVRVTFSLALDSVVKLWQIQLLPYRPSIDPTNFPEDALDRAGCYPHLLWGEPAQEGTAIWHDLGAIMTTITDVDEIGVLLFCEAGGSVGNNTNKLIAVGRNKVYLIEDFDDASDNWPFVSPSGLQEWGSTRVLNGKVGSLREVRVELRDMDALTNLFFYYRYDENERWSRQALGFRGNNATVTVRDDRGGVDFQWALGYRMAEDTVARRPKLMHAEADFEVLAISPDEIQQRPIPQVPRG